MQHKHQQQDNLPQEEMANHPRKSQKHTGEGMTESTKGHSEKRKNSMKDMEEEKSPALKDSKAKAEPHDRRR
jgi:hypothetical protein